MAESMVSFYKRRLKNALENAPDMNEEEAVVIKRVRA